MTARFWLRPIAATTIAMWLLCSWATAQDEAGIDAATGQSASQPESPTDVAAGTAAEDERSAPAAGAIASDGPFAPPTARGRPVVYVTPSDIWSRLSAGLTSPLLNWIAAFLILVLLIQPEQAASWRNVDAGVLALTSLLLPLRDELGALGGDPAARSVQYWSYILLSILMIYWTLRGLGALRAVEVSPMRANVAPAAMWILLIACALVPIRAASVAPLSDGSRDAMVGASALNGTGKLPYGMTPGYDARSPLLYGAHYAANMVPTLAARAVYDGDEHRLHWNRRSEWMKPGVLATVEPRGARAVNVGLFLLTLLGILLAGTRLHSLAVGQALAAIFCIFPGTIECVSHPDILLPTALLVWTAVAATVAGVGSIVAPMILVAAGLAWPWAWLGLPVLLAFYVRRGWQGGAAIASMLVAAAGAVAGVSALTAPTLPRTDGALLAAGVAPIFSAHLDAEGQLRLTHVENSRVDRWPARNWLWQLILKADRTSLSNIKNNVQAPSTNDPDAIRYHELAPDAGTVLPLAAKYADALEAQPPGVRVMARLRTALESTWLAVPETRAPRRSAWGVWSDVSSAGERAWDYLRLGSKVLAAILTAVVFFLLLRGPRAGLHHLFGGLLAILSVSLIASQAGAITNMVWFLPMALLLIATQVSMPGQNWAANAGRLAGQPEMSPPPRPGAPRITVNN